MIFVGDDWAEAHHDVYVCDEAGKKLAARRVPEGIGGIAVLHELVAGHAEDPGDLTGSEVTETYGTREFDQHLLKTECNHAPCLHRL